VSRRDFILIASVLADCQHVTQAQRRMLAADFTQALSAAWPNFRVDLFTDAATNSAGSSPNRGMPTIPPRRENP
jgi:hypothetical protein